MLRYLLLLYVTFTISYASERKKEEFFKKIVPPVTQAYINLDRKYNSVKEHITNGTNKEFIEDLKSIYGAKSDKELLSAIKPHPISIAIAQAAIESGWGTSRFFKEANNVFGVWSKDPKESRVSASKKRGNRTIWVRKYNSIKASVDSYYFLIGKHGAYRSFRELKMKDPDVYELVKKLNRYSETGVEYTKKVSAVIRHNNLTRYDLK